MKNVIANEYSKTEEGLKDLLRVVRGYADTYSPKLRDMEDAYLRANPHLYDDIEKEQLKYFREAFSYKFYLAAMHLEQIRALSHIGKTDYSSSRILENIFDLHRTTENGVLLFSFAFEGFIVEGNAFLDFYLLYLCHIFGIKVANRMSSRIFLNELHRIEVAPFVDKAEAVREYFKENVFGTGKEKVFLTDNWGTLLKKLRDSILHRDMLTPSFENKATLIKQITGNWHDSLKDISCSRFCTDAQNDMVELVTRIAALVYEVEWKPGPYRPNLWS
jgi:hypothetical protein